MAERGDLDTKGLRRLQHRRPVGDGHGIAVDVQGKPSLRYSHSMVPGGLLVMS